MDIMEIVLLVVGGIIFVLSFLISTKKDKNASGALKRDGNEVRKLVEEEMAAVKEHVDEVVEEAVGYAMEKAERSLERLSNEKIMAVNEYSDTVLAEIHKNHEEAMFLYDMLNEKHDRLKNAVSEVDRTVKKAEKTVGTFRHLSSGLPEEEPKGMLAEKKGSSQVGNAHSAKRSASRAGTAGSAGRSTSRTNNAPAELTGIQILERMAGKGKEEFPEIMKAVETGEPSGGFPAAAEENPAQAATFFETAESAGTVRPVEAVVPDGIGAAADTGEDTGSKKERILALYKQGMTKVAIAKELGMGVGEVMLVIDLYNN